MTYPYQKSAFTLVELLVVIAIIGVLAGLLLPAVQQVREAARRTECSNNIRQVGLALHMHHDSLRRLPSGWEVAVTSGSPLAIYDEDGLPGWGWASRILPFIEQSNLQKTIDYTLPIDHENYDSLRTTVISIYQCPSDPSPDVMEWAFLAGDDHDDHAHEGVMVSRCNYSGVFGNLEIEEFPTMGNGLFYQNSRLRFKDVTDGLSNTLMVGERLATTGTVTWIGVDPHIEEGAARVVGTCDHLPNDSDGHFEDFRSAHPTGANFLSADGSVRLIANFIDKPTYQGMATRSGGEIINVFD